MCKIFLELSERCQNHPPENIESEDECAEDTQETQFLRMQKNQLIDLKQKPGEV